AFNTTTNTWFNPFGTGLNNTCYAIIALGSILYVGGAFITVNGNSWSRIAAFNTITNTWFNPFGTGFNNTCQTFVNINDILYMGGVFTIVNGVLLNYITAFDTSISNAISIGYQSGYCGQSIHSIS